MGFYIYELTEVTLNFAGLDLANGYGEGGAIAIEKEDRDFQIVKGVDGTVTRSKTNQRVTNVKLTLSQSSPTNDILSTLLNVDLLAKNGGAVGPFLCRDRQGTSIITAEHAWIDGPPNPAYTNKATDKEWTIVLADPVRFDGGNAI